MDNGPPTSSRTVAAACWTLILLSTVLTLARLLQAEPLGSANDRSRWCTVRSLVELGTYQIDEARQVRGWDTIDIVRHEEHFYSSKPPLLSTIVAGLYWAERETVGWMFGDNLEPATRLILLVLNVVPMVVALALLTRLIRESSTTAFTAIFVTAAATFGTLLLPFLTVLNNHTVAATAVVFALYPLIRILQGHDAGWHVGRSVPRPARVWGQTRLRGAGWRYALVGFWAAFACCNELPAAAFGLATFGLAFWKSPAKAWLWFAPAALVPLAAYFYTNYLVTGGWKPFYAYYGTDKYLFVHEGVPSYWMQPKGIDTNRDGFGEYLLHCTFGHHGLLSLSPILLFTLLGWVTFPSTNARTSLEKQDYDKRNAGDALRPIHWTGLALSLIVFAFFMTRTENYNYGGISVALRWMLWLTPFWLLAMVPALDRVGRVSRPPIRIPAKSLACLALAVSTFSAWFPFSNPWQQPWLFTLMEHARWIDYSDPRPEFDRPVRTWVAQLPAGEAIRSDYWIELEGHQVDGSRIVLRIEDAGPVVVDDQTARIIRFSRREHESPVWTTDIVIGRAAFDAGAAPDELVLWPDGPPSEAEQQSVHLFLSGLPGSPEYRLIQERYLKVPLRTDAFQTERAYAQIPVGQDRCRREIWLNDAVPFGVVQVLDQVTDADGVVISRQNLAAIRAGTIPE